MFQKALSQCAVLLGLLLASGMIWADSVQKLGFIDTMRVYQESKQAQAIQKKLDKEFNSRQKDLEQMQKEGLKLKADLENNKIPENQREEKIKQIVFMDQQYRQQAVALAEDYNLRRNEEFASLQQNADQVIIDLAKKEGYDLIIQEAVFVNGKFDITDQVIKALNAKQ
ncbi:OmpH family outer membrane protein [Stenoxybacter acetivorans]|uniref:OmpH family outer membrane protein n=1 Tax=Stenoxybacter acetivorans TaxID=422441 RepID=UPI000562F546|nr:OmpH family outer membrane protein [Stenoxybacter acetivorans]